MIDELHEFETNVLSQLFILTEDEFYEIYKPIDNHLDNNASFDGKLYETFGDEKQYCFDLAQKENRVWTIIEADDEECECDDEDDPKCCLFIVSGFHYINRIGFMVTEIPYTSDVEVKLI